MSETDAPAWFTWFRDFGSHVAEQPTADLGEDGIRFLVSAPNADFVGWALATGAMSISKSPSRKLEFGEMAVSWDSGKMRDGRFEVGSGNAWAYFGSTGIAHGHTRPMAYVPESAPGNRSPRKVSDEDKVFLRRAWGERAWHMKYAEKCILPATIIGPRTELLEQLEELKTYCSNWLTHEELALFIEDSLQVSNPNKFGMFPFSVLNQGVAGPRPWLREMESRIVIASSFASHRGMSRYFQQGVPRVILTDRRSSGSSDAHALIEELINSGAKPLKVDFRRPPQGVHIFGFTERVLVDSGLEEKSEEIEEFEL